MAEAFLSLQDVADELGISVQTIRKWVKGGELAAYKPGKEYRIKHSDLEEFLKTREVAPKEAAGAQFPSLPGLRSARQRRGYSRNQLAVRAGVTPEEIAALEVGTLEADAAILDRLTASLDVTPGALGFPPEQYAGFLAADAQDNERIRRALAELSPSERRVLFSSDLLKSPGLRKLRDALDEEVADPRSDKRPEVG
jgi:excisionase family DNA binding protein